VVFTGAMDYWANVDAVGWFACEVFPRVRSSFPQARFYIVGARPARAVRDLARLPGVRVTGAVPDIRPYLAHSRAAVAPLRIARGVQNKVLEAMAMARPVVASPQAVAGIRPCVCGLDHRRARGHGAAIAEAVARACGCARRRIARARVEVLQLARESLSGGSDAGGWGAGADVRLPARRHQAIHESAKAAPLTELCGRRRPRASCPR
jgi:hypothetical protein